MQERSTYLRKEAREVVMVGMGAVGNRERKKRAHIQKEEKEKKRMRATDQNVWII